MAYSVHENVLTVLPFCHLDDCSFNAALYEMAHGPLHYDADRLDTLLFNPIDQSGLGNLLDNLDPDINFSIRPPTSSYMVHDEVNAISKSKQVAPCFSLLHINTRSLLGKVDDIISLVANMHQPFSVIGISETWLNDATLDLVNLPGYNFLSNHRTAKSRGGVGLYLQSGFEYQVLSESNFSDPNLIESLFVEISFPNGKNIVVETVYRPLNQNLPLFLEKFDQILSNISKNNKHCYIMGDYNIDMFRLNEHSPTQEFVESLFSHMFSPLINRPTRITAHSATLIDNIFSNHLTQNLFSGILINDLSDHLPIFVYTFKESLPLDKCYDKAVTRDFSENNVTKFRTYLTNKDWSNLLLDDDPNKMYNTF